MKRFKTFCVESFNSAYRYKKARGDGSNGGTKTGHEYYEANTKTGELLLVSLYWTVTHSKKQLSIDFTIDDSSGDVPRGEPLKILNTVLSVTKEVTKRSQPDKIYIEAQKDSWSQNKSGEWVQNANPKKATRGSVYKKMAQRFAAEMGYKLESVKDYDDHEVTIITITKR